MTVRRRLNAVPAIVAAAALTLQPTGAWAGIIIGMPGNDMMAIVGTPGDDIIFGDPAATVGLPTKIKRVSTGYLAVQLLTTHGLNANQKSGLGSNSANVFSTDGKRLLIVSRGTNLIQGFDNKSQQQAYSRDITTTFDVLPENTNEDNTAESVSSAGGAGTLDTLEAVYSPDGSKIAFVTKASELAGPTGSFSQIVVADLLTGKMEMISRSRSTGAAGTDDSSGPVFSPDSRRIAFASLASNLVPGDGNTSQDIFIVDIGYELGGAEYKTIARVSVAADGSEKSGNSYDPVFSPDGKQIAFTTAAVLSAADGSADPDVVLKDLDWSSPASQSAVPGSVLLVSSKEDGSDVSSCTAGMPAFSPDGGAIAFASNCGGLVSPSSGINQQIFVKALLAWEDLSSGGVVVVSRLINTVGDAESKDPAFSLDGSMIAFSSYASNLVFGANPPDNTFSNVFFKSVKNPAATGSASIVVSRKVDPMVVHSNGSSFNPVFSPGGSRIAFESSATNLVGADGCMNTNVDCDLNDVSDVYMAMLPQPTQGDDTNLLGGAGNDRVYGGGGADTMLPGLGDDLYDGGDNNDDPAGGDLAIIPGPQHRYEITKLPHGVVRLRDLTTNTSANGGTDILVNIEMFNFDPAPQALSRDQLHTGIINAAPKPAAKVIRLKAGTKSPVLVAATDANADALTVTLKADPAAGLVGLSPLGTFTYTAPKGTAVKSAAFTLHAADGLGGAVNVPVKVLIGVTLSGNARPNQLTGGPGDDTLKGAGGNDILIGAGGRDLLSGGSGADVFRYTRTSDSLPGAADRDVITDFSAASGDVIDLSPIDANTKRTRNQAFAFIGSRAFTGKPGQLRFKGGILSADVNGDKKPDMEIQVKGKFSKSRLKL